jgi:hypothetical protein
MEFHCNSIVSTMPEKGEKGDPETRQFSITLPVDAIEMIENGLIPFGLYGKKLATVAANLILDALKTPAVRGNIREGREKGSR